MGIDEPGHDDAALNIDDAPGSITGSDDFLRSSGDDDAAINGDRAMLNESNAVSRHRQKMATRDQRVKHQISLMRSGGDVDAAIDAACNSSRKLRFPTREHRKAPRFERAVGLVESGIAHPAQLIRN